jgi:cleavage and polyadenylation specificity factor subunit 1
MQALHQEILPPSGVEFATTLKLTPSTLPEVSPLSSSASQDQTSRSALYNLVVARANILRLFEVKESPAPISSQLEDERQRRTDVRRGTEAVEGEVEMDRLGEGFINMGTVKVISDTFVSMFGPFPMTDFDFRTLIFLERLS